MHPPRTPTHSVLMLTEDLPDPNSTTKISLFQGTFIQYMQAHSVDPSRTVLLTLNGGFGNWVESKRYGLLHSWFNDLVAVVESGIPAFFTQANDYADLVGEVPHTCLSSAASVYALQVALFTSAIETSFILPPGHFSAVLTAHSPCCPSLQPVLCCITPLRSRSTRVTSTSTPQATY